MSLTRAHIFQRGALSFGLCLCLSFGVFDAAAENVARVISHKGVVMAQTPDRPPRILGPGDALDARQVINVTRDSHVILEFADRSRVTLRPGTTLALGAYRKGLPQSLLSGLRNGGIRVQARPGVAFDARLCADDCTGEGSLPGDQANGLTLAARVVAISGLASASSTTGRRLLVPGAGIHETESVTTGPSSNVVLAFRDGSRISLSAKSRLSIPEFKYNIESRAGKALLVHHAGYAQVVTGAISKQGPGFYRFVTKLGEVTPHGTIFGSGSPPSNPINDAKDAADQAGQTIQNVVDEGSQALDAAGQKTENAISEAAALTAAELAALAEEAARLAEEAKQTIQQVLTEGKTTAEKVGQTGADIAVNIALTAATSVTGGVATEIAPAVPIFINAAKNAAEQTGQKLQDVAQDAAQHTEVATRNAADTAETIISGAIAGGKAGADAGADAGETGGREGALAGLGSPEVGGVVGRTTGGLVGAGVGAVAGAGAAATGGNSASAGADAGGAAGGAAGGGVGGAVGSSVVVVSTVPAATAPQGFLVGVLTGFEAGGGTPPSGEGATPPQAPVIVVWDGSIEIAGRMVKKDELIRATPSGALVTGSSAEAPRFAAPSPDSIRVDPTLFDAGELSVVSGLYIVAEEGTIVVREIGATSEREAAMAAEERLDPTSGAAAGGGKGFKERTSPLAGSKPPVESTTGLSVTTLERGGSFAMDETTSAREAAMAAERLDPTSGTLVDSGLGFKERTLPPSGGRAAVESATAPHVSTLERGMAWGERSDALATGSHTSDTSAGKEMRVAESTRPVDTIRATAGTTAYIGVGRIALLDYVPSFMRFDSTPLPSGPVWGVSPIFTAPDGSVFGSCTVR